MAEHMANSNNGITSVTKHVNKVNKAPNEGTVFCFLNYNYTHIFKAKFWGEYLLHISDTQIHWYSTANKKTQ
jgi:hypothetical protein